ncbi:MAG: hypothetical protein BWK80_33370 [Desulfobacteraceae bacterium IS3]|nr:MAG: hypothetical protein BWK80_33370 [Desulfobacteraceae bacterium IS3]
MNIAISDKGLGINKIYPITRKCCPEMNFRAVMCRPYATYICPVRTSHNSPAIYCRESVLNFYI